MRVWSCLLSAVRLKAMRKQGNNWDREGKDPSCLVTTVQAGGGGGVF